MSMIAPAPGSRLALVFALMCIALLPASAAEIQVPPDIELVMARMFDYESAGIRSFSCRLSGPMIEKHLQKELGATSSPTDGVMFSWMAPDSMIYWIAGEDLTDEQRFSIVETMNKMSTFSLNIFFSPRTFGNVRRDKGSKADAGDTDDSPVFLGVEDGLAHFTAGESIHIWIDPATMAVARMRKDGDSMSCRFTWENSLGLNRLKEVTMVNVAGSDIPVSVTIVITNHFADSDGLPIPTGFTMALADSTGANRIPFSTVTISDVVLNGIADPALFHAHETIRSARERFRSPRFGYTIEIPDDWKRSEERWTENLDFVLVNSSGDLGAGMMVQPYGAAGLERYFEMRKLEIGQRAQVLDASELEECVVGSDTGMRFRFKIRFGRSVVEWRAVAVARGELVYEFAVWGSSSQAGIVESELTRFTERIGWRTDDIDAIPTENPFEHAIPGTTLSLAFDSMAWKQVDPLKFGVQAGDMFAFNRSWGFLMILSDTSGMTLDELEEYGFMTLEDIEPISRREGRIGSADLREIWLDGNVGGIPLRYGCLFMTDGELNCQIYSWCVEDASDLVEPALRRILDSLRNQGMHANWYRDDKTKPDVDSPSLLNL